MTIAKLEPKAEFWHESHHPGTAYCKRCGEYKEVLIIHKNGDTFCMKCQNKVMRQKRMFERTHN